MKLRCLSEIQHKTPSTTMSRANTPGTYGVGSINDLFRVDDDAEQEQTQEPAADPTPTPRPPSP